MCVCVTKLILQEHKKKALLYNKVSKFIVCIKEMSINIEHAFDQSI